MPLRLISVFGLLAFIGLAWLLSSRKRAFPVRTVCWGLALQFAFAVLILKTSPGRAVFDFAGRAIRELVGVATEGTKFVFGSLADRETMAGVFGPENALVLGILIVGTIIVVAMLSSVFYHWGILQRVVHAMAWVMRKAMRTSGAETLSAAANVFMGQTEAPLLVKPYIPRMTRSELLCLMTGGMATIAGGVAAVYAAFGEQAGHPDVAGHLLTASVLNAPAALLIAKILLPETEASETAGTAPKDPPRTTVNSVDALCRGASDGMMLSINVIAMLIAFVALVALVNLLLVWPQQQMGIAEPVTLQTLLGLANAPFAWLMGIPGHDCAAVGSVLGERIVLSEFIGYLSLNRLTVDERSYAIATYALCGFANVASVAIQVGGIGSLAPERRGDMAKLGIKAMIGGLLACYLTACIAGILL
jgi:CNT family concentrative nucleoside transporter